MGTIQTCRNKIVLFIVNIPLNINQNIMVEKIKELLGSLRFWIVTLGWLTAYLAKVESEGFVLATLFEQLSYWFGTVVTIGTMDSVALGLAGKKK